MASYDILYEDRNAIESIESLWGMKMPKLLKLSFSYNQLISMKIIRKLTLPLLIQLQLDHNYLLLEDGFSQGKYHTQIKAWIYFAEDEIHKNKVNQCINSKLYPIKMRY